MRTYIQKWTMSCLSRKYMQFEDSQPKSNVVISCHNLWFQSVHFKCIYRKIHKKSKKTNPGKRICPYWEMVWWFFYRIIGIEFFHYFFVISCPQHWRATEHESSPGPQLQVFSTLNSKPHNLQKNTSPSFIWWQIAMNNLLF